MPRLQFWYEFASNYSYLSAMRIGRMAEAAGMDVDWRPFLLGPILKSQGWDTSPFNIYPAKGRFMVRDMQRIAQERGIGFVMPKQFPANSLLVTRLALLGEEEGWTERFSRAVYLAEFEGGDDISDKVIVAGLLEDLDIEVERALSMANSEAIKTRLKQRTAEATSLDIFGAPSFITESGELFWGDDRLEQALDWARRG